MMKSLRGTGIPVDGFEEMKRYHYTAPATKTSPPTREMEKAFVHEVRGFLREQLGSRR